MSYIYSTRLKFNRVPFLGRRGMSERRPHCPPSNCACARTLLDRYCQSHHRHHRHSHSHGHSPQSRQRTHQGPTMMSPTTLRWTCHQSDAMLLSTRRRSQGTAAAWTHRGQSKTRYGLQATSAAESCWSRAHRMRAVRRAAIHCRHRSGWWWPPYQSGARARARDPRST